MNLKSALAIAVVALTGGTAYVVTTSGQADESSVPVYLTRMPDGYRDWRLVSAAHEEGNLHSLGAVLGNDTAIKAYRAGTLPYPDGTAIAALHFHAVQSAENDRIFGRQQSVVPGAPTNVQFEIKDSKKYAATGGWGFGSFDATDGKPSNEALMKTCAPCHAKASRDFVFTRYAP